MNDLRPCTFKTEDDEVCKGYFHTWEQIQVSKTAFMRGIIEKENGEVVKVAPTCITFTDRKDDVVINDDYNRGLVDAWKLAEKICRMQYVGLEDVLGVEYDDMEDYFINFTPQKVLEKLNG